MSLFNRATPKRSNRIAKLDMNNALRRYCMSHNKPIGSNVAGGLYVYEWGDHPVKFYLAEAGTHGGRTQVSPQMTRREMYEWLMTK